MRHRRRFEIEPLEDRMALSGAVVVHDAPVPEFEATKGADKIAFYSQYSHDYVLVTATPSGNQIIKHSDHVPNGYVNLLPGP